MVDAKLAPMEMRSVAEIPSGEGWQYEPKWDGFRALAHRDGERVEIVSKSGQPLGRYFPEVIAALLALDDQHVSLDGELVVAEAGTLSFDTLQQRIHPAASRIAKLSLATPAQYLVFDLLREGGQDMVDLPLAERRAVLEAFAVRFVGSAVLALSPATTSRAVVDDWFARVGGALDGVVAKRLDQPYLAGKRDGAVKIKQRRTADCVVGGFRLAAGSTDRIGSLLLGLYDAAGALHYIGFCSSFSAAERRALFAQLSPLGGGSGFSGNSPGGPSRWNRGDDRDRSFTALDPELVVEVEFDQVTAGRIRHGTRFMRWRTDKAPRRCTTDQLESEGAVLALLATPPG